VGDSPEPGNSPEPIDAPAPSARVPGRLRTAVALLLVDLGLRLFGFARMSRLLGGGAHAPADGVTGSATGSGAAGADSSRAERLARRIEGAAGFRVYRVPCLPRALLLRRWLLARGLPATLRIGARREGPRVRAHAWVECAGTVLDPDPSVGERFPPLEG